MVIHGCRPRSHGDTLPSCSPHTQLRGLCWSLRNSQQRRVTLEKEMRWKIFPSSTFQQGREDHPRWEKPSWVDPEAGSAPPAPPNKPRSLTAVGSCPGWTLKPDQLPQAPPTPFLALETFFQTEALAFFPLKCFLGLFAQGVYEAR